MVYVLYQGLVSALHSPAAKDIIHSWNMKPPAHKHGPKSDGRQHWDDTCYVAPMLIIWSSIDQKASLVYAIIWYKTQFHAILIKFKSWEANTKVGIE